MTVALVGELKVVPPQPNRRSTDRSDDCVKVANSQLLLAERSVHFRQIEGFYAEYRPAQYHNKPSNVLWWSGAAALAFALFEINDLEWAKAMVAVSVAAVAFAGHYAGHLFSPPPLLVSPERWAVEVELKDGKTLPLFTTPDGDFAERAAKRLDALLTLGEDVPNLVILPRELAIRATGTPPAPAVAAARPAPEAAAEPHTGFGPMH